MRHHIRSLFSPPHLASEEETRLAGLLYVILWVLLAAALVSAFFGYLLRFPITATTLCVGSLFILLSLWLTHRGHINLAGFVTLTSLLVAMTYLAFVGQGIFDRSLLVLPIIIIIASLVLTQRFFVLITLLCVAAAGLLVWAEQSGWIVTSFNELVSPFDFVAVAFILVVTAVFTRLTASSLQQSLSRARENELALAEINRELEEQKRAIQQRENETQTFQETLKTLHRVGFELSRAESLDELYRRAVELSLSELGFERVGLLLYDAEAGDMVGTYGTNPAGRVVNESSLRGKPGYTAQIEMLAEKSNIFLLEDVPLYFDGIPVGRGWNAVAALWDGDKGIGWLATDNLLSSRPPAPFQLDLLVLYATTIGHLITRLRHAEALRDSEAEARLFQEKLQALYEVSIALAGAETLEALYQQAIELGRARLGFDRLGLLLYDEETHMIVGTFGTDDDGRLRDERYFRERITNQEIMGMLESNQRLGFWENAILRDNGKAIGQGWNAMSGLWNGSKGIGWLATDNLIRREPPSPVQLELLILYGSLLGHLVTLKRNEAAIQAYAQELERSNRELQQFAYVSSHDLQEPLRKIQAFGDRLQQRYAHALDERGVDYLQRMQDAAARMQTLIQDVLAFSRVDTQARPFTLVDLTKVMNDVLSDLEMRIEETRATINLHPLPSLEADATQMRQLFQNLLSNALKFHQPDVPPVIDVHCEQMVDGLEDGRFCQIVVQDNGIGFDEKYSERIFGVFQRLHGRSQYEGTGVGLAVCKRIVERHHGRISATSKPGHGAAFTVFLPMQQSDRKQSAVTTG